MKYFILLMSLFAIPAFPKVLSYHKGEESFQLQNMTDKVRFFQRETSLEIKRNVCNKKMIEDFWLEVETNFAKLPRVNGVPQRQLAYVKMDQTIALPFGFGYRESNFFNRIPNKFFLLSQRAGRICR